MDLLAKYLYRATYDRVAYEPIRDDFISWYMNAYHDLDISDNIDKNNAELVELAQDARTEALRYEPDTALNNAIEVTSEAERILRVFTAILSLVGCSISAILVYIGVISSYSPIISFVSGIFSTAFLVIPGSAFPFYIILKYTIRTNGELIRLYNEELVIPIGEINRNERWSDKVTAYYVHHSSLCSTTQIPVIVFLGVLRTVSPRTYGRVSARLRADVSEFKEENIWRVIGKEYSRIRHGVLPGNAF